MAVKRYIICLSLAAGILFCVHIASAQTGQAGNSRPSVIGQPEEIAPVADQRALDILKGMSDTLKTAGTISFRARSLEPVRFPGGMWIILFSDSHVIRQGSDRLFVEKRGDVFALDIYFNGTTMSLYSPAKNVFARKEAPGTIDAMIERADTEAENLFPYADILISDPYSRLTAGMLKAVYIGRSTLGGVKTDHLAFSNKGVEWQIWIGADDKLPRLVNATYLDDASEPSYTVEFSGWKLNDPVARERFAYRNTSEAAQVEFKRPDFKRSGAAI